MGETINKRVSSHWVRGSVTAQVYLLCMSLHTRDLRKCLLPHPVRLNTYSNLKGALPPWLRLSSLKGYPEGSQCSVTRQPVSQCLQYPGWLYYFPIHSWAGKEILSNLTKGLMLQSIRLWVQIVSEDQIQQARSQSTGRPLCPMCNWFLETILLQRLVCSPTHPDKAVVPNSATIQLHPILPRVGGCLVWDATEVSKPSECLLFGIAVCFLMSWVTLKSSIKPPPNWEAKHKLLSPSDCSWRQDF